MEAAHVDPAYPEQDRRELSGHAAVVQRVQQRLRAGHRRWHRRGRYARRVRPVRCVRGDGVAAPERGARHELARRRVRGVSRLRRRQRDGRRSRARLDHERSGRHVGLCVRARRRNRCRGRRHQQDRRADRGRDPARECVRGDDRDSVSVDLAMAAMVSAGTPVAITGNAFAYTLPANSVTTLVLR